MSAGSVLVIDQPRSRRLKIEPSGHCGRERWDEREYIEFGHDPAPHNPNFTGFQSKVRVGSKAFAPPYEKYARPDG